MPILNWIGKEAVVNHDKKVSFKLLKKVKANSIGENSQNLIIHGDNLEALKALMPYYIGKVKCIYIDPPYNTGNEKWVYNDRVNSPKIKKWLGKVVGGEAEDLCRHDKWLCMMYPRLKLLRDLLREDGVIFVSIDDNEHCNLKQALDEIFGEENFIANFIWNSTKSITNPALVSVAHTINIAFAKNKHVFEAQRHKFKLPAILEGFSNLDNDPRGSWKADPFEAGGIRPNQMYPIKNPNTGEVFYPAKGNCWKNDFKKFQELLADNRIVFGKNNKGRPQRKRFIWEAKERGLTPNTWWNDVGTTTNGTMELKELFGEKVFNNPKPTSLIKRIMTLGAEKDSLILDSFAGSGTTGHAVLDLNKEDGGNRKFILIEMEEDIAKKITAKRIKKAIEKYDYKDGFEYCELDKPLFDENGQIEETCDFNQFATYIYFTETQTNIDKRQISGNFIGDYNEISYYLLFREKGKNVLGKIFLNKLKGDKNKKVIYADKCLIDEETLNKHNIQFKQIPYEVKVY
mgnify:CR=1 FL=1